MARVKIEVNADDHARRRQLYQPGWRAGEAALVNGVGHGAACGDWRTLVPAVAQALQEAYGRNLVIPMTIWREAYFGEIMTGLHRVDADLHHFCLTAPLATIQSRLHQRARQEDGEPDH